MTTFDAALVLKLLKPMISLGFGIILVIGVNGSIYGFEEEDDLTVEVNTFQLTAASNPEAYLYI